MYLTSMTKSKVNVCGYLQPGQHTLAGHTMRPPLYTNIPTCLQEAANADLAAARQDADAQRAAVAAAAAAAEAAREAHAKELDAVTRSGKQVG
jgi:hypothetical protein